MAYEEAHAKRFRLAIEGIDGTSEKRMMGGVCFLVNGNMIGGVGQSKEGDGRFLFRVGKTNVEAAEQLPGGEALVQGGRRMSGFYFVKEKQCDGALFEKWLSLALNMPSSFRPNEVVFSLVWYVPFNRGMPEPSPSLGGLPQARRWL